MTLINLTDSPEDIFKAAAVDTRKAGLALEAAKAKISAEQAAFDNASANLAWVAAHPALADVDKNALYQSAIEGVTLDDVATEETPDAQRTVAEPAKPKRTRRTKEQIAADKAAEEAAAAAARGEEPSVAPAAAPEAAQEPVSAPAEPTPAPAAVSDPFASAGPAPAAQADPFATGGPATPPQAAFDPFGTGA